MDLNIDIYIFAIGIILVLASYAVLLLIKLKKQGPKKTEAEQKQEQLKQEKLNERIDSIRYIAEAMISERCDISEGVMRIGKLFTMITVSEHLANDALLSQYPAIRQHFTLIENHPILDKRKELAKQERMKLDLSRIRSEGELTEQILAEAKQLTNFYQLSINR